MMQSTSAHNYQYSTDLERVYGGSFFDCVISIGRSRGFLKRKNYRLWPMAEALLRMTMVWRMFSSSRTKQGEVDSLPAGVRKSVKNLDSRAS